MPAQPAANLSLTESFVLSVLVPVLLSTLLLLPPKIEGWVSQIAPPFLAYEDLLPEEERERERKSPKAGLPRWKFALVLTLGAFETAAWTAAAVYRILNREEARNPLPTWYGITEAIVLAIAWVRPRAKNSFFLQS